MAATHASGNATPGPNTKAHIARPKPAVHATAADPAAASLAAVSTVEKTKQPEPEVAEDTEEIVMEEKPAATTPEEDTPEAAVQREKEETEAMDTTVIGA